MNKEFIVVHAGRRDDYQVALALHESKMLKCLVTEFYSPFDSFLGKLLSRSSFVKSRLNKRYKKGLPSSKTSISYRALGYLFLYRITGKVKYDNLKGVSLGEKAYKLSQRYNTPIISMNTYATEAFTDNPLNPKILFQFHPHPHFVKQIFEEEIRLNPKSERSLLQEYEFSIPELELEKLSKEILLATHYICASSLTKQSLLTEGVNENKVKVIPYGVDITRFPFFNRETLEGNKFNVLFIGSLNQRKGITYLLDALNLLENVRLFIVGRGIFDQKLLEGYSFEIEVFQNISNERLIEVMHKSNCFVLPSILEGFGQVILEAMATGLPVIASENTAAVDIIDHGNDGFVVPIRDSKSIADILFSLSEDKNYALNIGKEAHKKAIKYTWLRFRQEIIYHINNI